MFQGGQRRLHIGGAAPAAGLGQTPLLPFFFFGGELEQLQFLGTLGSVLVQAHHHLLAAFDSELVFVGRPGDFPFDIAGVDGA